ncbi:hypothetical protein K435DRAFT_811392 [Dendrothele bispora CBS 962.96]|uniref:Uncharacterized protein n=1 Tax=Dendrothele bispora (strain CBS 962.96) TaxID=1314807 RepID=A0A4S8KS90_DENBC|nr:hypothetical protein K435DRAFT_811392 [Dendrothele bispora CBS 962.96]
MSMTKVISLTVLANGRVIDGKSLLFDTNLYVSDGEQIVAALQYFNQDNRKFPLVGKYEVVATIAKMPPKIEINDSIVLEDTEYDAIGDIIMLHSVEIDDPKQRPLIEIIGKAENVLKKDAEFDVNAEQYIRLLGGKGILPVHALIPDSAKYKTKRDGSSSKPVPNQNSSLELSGFITRVIPREGDPEERVDRFCVAVEGVTFLGRSSGSNVLPEGSRVQLKSELKLESVKKFLILTLINHQRSSNLAMMKVQKKVQTNDRKAQRTPKLPNK